MLARILDSLRKLVYRGRVKDIIIHYGINDNLRDLYWRVYKMSVGDDIEVTINGSSAVFSISTYPEYRVVNAVQGEEKPVVEKLITELKTDDIVWDVGANIGTFSCLMGDLLKEGKIIAFEPYPPNIDKLEENLERNSIHYDIIPLALSDTNDTVTFHAVHADEAGTQQGSIASDYADIQNAKETININSVSGDQLISKNEVPIPNVVKIDAEGAGPEVIDGMTETLRSPNCRLVVIEPHQNSDIINKKLSDIGFKLNGIELADNREGEHPTIVASKN